MNGRIIQNIAAQESNSGDESNNVMEEVLNTRDVMRQTFDNDGMNGRIIIEHSVKKIIIDIESNNVMEEVLTMRVVMRQTFDNDGMNGRIIIEHSVKKIIIDIESNNVWKKLKHKVLKIVKVNNVMEEVFMRQTFDNDVMNGRIIIEHSVKKVIIDIESNTMR
ncbi:hypothetical protein CEXT_91121 [Caerostris extrusa]|uniref:Uncharacterized protein n=1 Tax=Caerostris extrusa TaxID=172846 RepID=A0AAV4R5S6_CAEEX|nr:hypothetical protein CEXT_91121 [Caerostris extrusa]